MTSRSLSIVTLYTLGAAMAFAQEPQIDLFYVGDTSFFNPANSVVIKHDLNALIEEEQTTSAGLSKNETIARKQVNELLNDAMRKRIIAAAGPHILAHRYQIQFIPAVVIDRQYVYYGRDVENALRLWRNHHVQP